MLLQHSFTWIPKLRLTANFWFNQDLQLVQFPPNQDTKKAIPEANILLINHRGGLLLL